ncbi:hypothetical protein [Streptomyces sp. NPDC002599]|uniref:hypothetical protein n=1 Tax=Streptomyces sp. NPDC002599 TaxID=3154421 RepID=UPI003329D988
MRGKWAWTALGAAIVVGQFIVNSRPRAATVEVGAEEETPRQYPKPKTIYRVTYVVLDTHEKRIHDIVDIDNGYDFYLMMKRSADVYKVTWEHIPCDASGSPIR